MSDQTLYLTSYIPDGSEQTPYLTFCKSDNADMLYIELLIG